MCERGPSRVCDAHRTFVWLRFSPRPDLPCTHRQTALACRRWFAKFPLRFGRDAARDSLRHRNRSDGIRRRALQLARPGVVCLERLQSFVWLRSLAPSGCSATRTVNFLPCFGTRHQPPAKLVHASSIAIVSRRAGLDLHVPDYFCRF